MRKLFGGPRVGAVALVEAPVSRVYARKARSAFFVVTVAGGVLASAVSGGALPLPVALMWAAVAGLAVTVVIRAWPVLRAVWWWAGEIGAVAAVVGVATWIADATSPIVAVVLVVMLAGVVGLVPPVRRLLVVWVWCAVVRHRLRLCFAEVIRSANRVSPVCLPLVLWARPTPAGERVWLWLRPGLDLEELEGRTGRLAVACWASEVRLVRASARYAALLRVDVARRDPLTGDVATPLMKRVPKPSDDDETASVLATVLPFGLDLADVPEEPPDPPRAVRR
jgi:hypothetical protein